MLTQNAPADVRAGVGSLDRVVQQTAKSAAPGAMGLLLLVADVRAVFWVLGALSLVSIVLAALLLGARPHPRAGGDGVARQDGPARWYLAFSSAL